MAKILFPDSRKYPLIDREPRLSKLNMTPGGHTVWVWGDDPDGFAYGGNKVRFYEYLIPEIQASGAKMLLTSGSLYSNHIRVSAEVAKKLGLECRVFTTADRPDDSFFEKENNITLAEKLGATLIFGGSFAAMLKIEEYKKQLDSEGVSYFHVPNAGHTPGAIRAYADVAYAALSELSSRGISPDRIYLPCASGTTTAGVMEGCALARLDGMYAPPVTGIRVGNTPRGAARGVRELLDRAPDFPGAVACPAAPEIGDCGKNAYGCPDAELLALRDSVFREEGLLLDRTYNINAFHGMLLDLESHPGHGDVLYIHTGGYSK